MVRVVLVEDDAFVREDLRLELSEAGHSVRVHGGGRHAMCSIMEWAPDVIITDIVMEDGEGMDLIAKINQVCPQAIVIAISSRSKYLTYAAALGAHYTLQKPFRPAALMQIMQEVCTRAPQAFTPV